MLKFRGDIRPLMWVFFVCFFTYFTLRNLPLRDAALRTNMLTPPVVVVGKKDRDTPSEGDYMERKLKT